MLYEGGTNTEAFEMNAGGWLDDPKVLAANDLIASWLDGGGDDGIRVAEKALRISPLCVDAYAILARKYDDSDPERAISLWRKGIEAGAAVLGTDFFKENAGEFWLDFEARSYLKAKAGLAMALFRAGRRAEAIDEMVDMLRLNRNDNQGIRYSLAAALVETERYEELYRFVDMYQHDGSPMWRWNTALAAFLRGEDAATEKLVEAFEGNAHIAEMLIFLDDQPGVDGLTEMQSGSLEEASFYLSMMFEGWSSIAGAREWVMNVYALIQEDTRSVAIH